MFRTLFKSKLHRATVTEACLNYVGSITIDEDLMDAADIMINEKVQVVDVNNGSRLETYAIPGARGTGVICLNGAAARLVQPGDKVIIITYVMLEESEAKEWKPRVAFLDDANRITEMKNEEKHGEIK